MRRICTIATLIVALITPAIAAGKATTKSNSKAIAKLQHDVAIISAREKDDAAQVADTAAAIAFLSGCFGALPSDLFLLPDGVNMAYVISDTPTFWSAFIDEACLLTPQGTRAAARLRSAP